MYFCLLGDASVCNTAEQLHGGQLHFIFYFWGHASVAAASGHACVLCIGEQLNGDWQRCHSLSMQAALFQEAPFPLGTGGPFPGGGGGGV